MTKSSFVFLHGARASGTSFNYIRGGLNNVLNEADDIVLNYSSDNSFKNNLACLKNEIDAALSHRDQHQTLFFVGHSLGGIYALYLAELFNDVTMGGITLSTPYGGSAEAYLLKTMMPFSKLLADIVPTSPVMIGARAMQPVAPWLNVVTVVGGNPLISRPNDGVVSIESMQANPNIPTVTMDTNHYEVMLHECTVPLIATHHQSVVQLQHTAPA